MYTVFQYFPLFFIDAVSPIRGLQFKMGKYKDHRVPVSNPGIEDTCTIDYVICLRQSLWKAIPFHVFSVLTLGFLWLLGHWSTKLRSKLNFQECDVSQATHFMIYNWDNKWTITKREDMLVLSSKSAYQESITFTNRNIRYFYDEAREAFSSHKYDISARLKQLKNDQVHIYPQSERKLLHAQFGRCVVEVKVDSTLKLFLAEILSPYEVFQFYAIVYWLITQYYIFPIILLIASVCSHIYDIRLLQQGQRKLRSDSLIATVIQYLTVTQNGVELQKGHSEVLVPGDLFYINEKQKLPCDCVIIKGSAFINEEYLTANPTPCHKSELYNLQYQQGKESNSFLYMGTQIVCIENENLHNSLPGVPAPQYKSILCLAIRTNYSSLRGQYLRNILYPKPHAFKLFTESISFLVIMFVINALGFFAVMLKVRKYLDSSHIVVLFLDLLTTAIPPTLPTAMSVGIGFAIRRLNQLDIKCMVKQKVLVGGRLDTLLIQHSSLLAKIQINIPGFVLNVPKSDMELRLIKENNPKNQMINTAFEGMATAHSLYKPMLPGQQCLGTATDIQILRFLHAEILDDNDTIKMGQTTLVVEDKIHIEANVIRVAAYNSKDSSKKVFIRGTYEKVLPMCDASTISTNIEESITKLASHGYEMLALAYTQTDTDALPDNESQRFQFLGFIIIGQKRQYNSFSTMQTLKSANMHSIILSKENNTHAVNAAIFCGLLLSNKDLMYCDIKTGQNGCKKIQRTYLDFTSSDRQQLSAPPGTTNTEDELTKQFILSVDEIKPLQICMSGDVIQQLYNRKEIAPFKYILEKTIVFSNLQQKHYSIIVEAYQELGHLVSLVGGNVRDNSFKQADVGLALTSHQLSSLSHFSAKKLNVGAIVDLLRIAKASLSCNFQTFRMMCLFSLTQFTTYVLLYMDYQQLNDSQNLYIDLFVLCPIFICLSLTEPCSKLAKQKPSASLFSIGNVLSMTGLFLIQLVAQIVMVQCLKSRKYLLEFEKDSLAHILVTDQFDTGTYQATNLFVFSNFLYIGIVLATSVSKPFRQQFYTNIPLMVNILLLWVYNVLIPFDSILVPESMEIKHLHGDWVITIILAANFVCLLMYLYEYLTLAVTRRLRRKCHFD